MMIMQEEYPQYTEEQIKEMHEALKLPKRATKGSAGYDFFAPFTFKLTPGETIKIPTGIRAEMQEDWVLQIYPRSGLGFKYTADEQYVVASLPMIISFRTMKAFIFSRRSPMINGGQDSGDPCRNRIVVESSCSNGITEDDDAEAFATVVKYYKIIASKTRMGHDEVVIYPKGDFLCHRTCSMSMTMEP